MSKFRLRSLLVTPQIFLNTDISKTTSSLVGKKAELWFVYIHFSFYCFLYRLAWRILAPLWWSSRAANTFGRGCPWRWRPWCDVAVIHGSGTSRSATTTRVGDWRRPTSRNSETTTSEVDVEALTTSDDDDMDASSSTMTYRVVQKSGTLLVFEFPTLLGAL